MGELMPEKKIIGVEWAYKTKYNSDGSLDKYKARLAAKGHTQEYGIDYEEVYSLVARLDIVRIFLAVAVFKKWPIFQLDIKSAFLNGEIEEEVHIYGTTKRV